MKKDNKPQHLFARLLGDREWTPELLVIAGLFAATWINALLLLA